MTAKKFTKKRDAHAKVVVLLIKPIVFLKFSLLSPSSDLKVPNFTRATRGENLLCLKRKVETCRFDDEHNYEWEVLNTK